MSYIAYGFHFVESGTLEYIHTLTHHTIDTYLQSQWAAALRCGKAESEMAHLLEVVATSEMPLQNEATGATAYYLTEHSNALDIMT